MSQKRKKPQPKRRSLLQTDGKRFVEYLVSGGAYFWAGYLIFFLCDRGLHWNLWWAKLSANVFGWTVNYLLQRFWVFRNSSLAKHRTEVTGRYVFITLVDFVLDYLIVRELKIFGITPYIGQFISSGFFTMWNYLWYRNWVFANRMHRRHKKSKK